MSRNTVLVGSVPCPFFIDARCRRRPEHASANGPESEDGEGQIVNVVQVSVENPVGTAMPEDELDAMRVVLSLNSLNRDMDAVDEHSLFADLSLFEDASREEAHAVTTIASPPPAPTDDASLIGERFLLPDCLGFVGSMIADMSQLEPVRGALTRLLETAAVPLETVAAASASASPSGRHGILAVPPAASGLVDTSLVAVDAGSSREPAPPHVVTNGQMDILEAVPVNATVECLSSAVGAGSSREPAPTPVVAYDQMDMLETVLLDALVERTTSAPAAAAPAPEPPAVDGTATTAVAAAATTPATSVDDFISSLSAPLETPILSSRPKLRVSQEPDYSIVPRRSLRLADKPKDSNPEVQATRVMLKKLGRYDPPPSSDDSGARRFKETFGGALSSSKKEAMRELFPARRRFGSTRTAC
jgi:hypothetical protein